MDKNAPGSSRHDSLSHKAKELLRLIAAWHNAAIREKDLAADFDALMARLEVEIAKESAAMDALLERLNRPAA